MIIAVPFQDGEIFQHFGKSRAFKIFHTEGKEILTEEMLEVTGEGHGALAGLLKESKVDTVILGGAGAHARTSLREAGIQVYPGVKGSVREAVESLLNGTLILNEQAGCCDHSGEHHH